jgi:hypothetical protein
MKHLVYFMDVWNILWTFGIFYENLVYFKNILYIQWWVGIFLAVEYILWTVDVVSCQFVFFLLLVCCTEKNLAPPVRNFASLSGRRMNSGKEHDAGACVASLVTWVRTKKQCQQARMPRPFLCWSLFMKIKLCGSFM